MKRSGVITWVVGLCLSCFWACSSDSDILSDKELLSEALVNEAWQVTFQHAMTKRTLEHPEIRLAFSDLGNVNAYYHQSEHANTWDEREGAYSLLYDEEDYKSFNSEADANDDELVLFNERWKVKQFSSSLVVLRANDLSLRLTKSNDMDAIVL